VHEADPHPTLKEKEQGENAQVYQDPSSLRSKRLLIDARCGLLISAKPQRSDESVQNSRDRQMD
jgi:hypothetical protein